MAKFVFKLEAVLRERAQTEKRRQRELAAVQARFSRISAALDANHARLRDTTNIVRANRVGRLDTRLLAEGARFAFAIREKISGLRAELHAIRPELARAQEALVEAAKQRKVLEKLRETQKLQWTAAQEKKEAQALDEIGAAIGRYLGQDI